MASNTQRARLSRRLWGKLREIGGEAITLDDDPLANRYVVNKHGIRAGLPDEDSVKDTLDRLIALLVVEGWTIRREPERNTIYVSNRELGPATAVINPRTVLKHDMRLDISVY